MKHMNGLQRKGILVALILVVGLGFGIAAGVFHAIAFTGPSATAGSGVGALGTDASGDLSIGTSTTQSNTKLIIVGSTSDSSAYALQVWNTSGTGTLLSVRNDGAVSIPGAFSAGTLTATVNASNITSGQFASGNFSFPGKLAIGSTTPFYTLDIFGGDLNLAAGQVYRYGGVPMYFASATINSYYLGNAGNQSSTGFDNTGVGNLALAKNTSGYDNEAFGTNALASNTTGYYNTAMGHFALAQNLNGAGNSAYGIGALGNNTSGSFNTAVGISAMALNNTGNFDTAVGQDALEDSTAGTYNTGIGSGAFQNGNGSYNTALGSLSGFVNTTGNGNVFIGYEAGYWENGSNKLYITNTSTTHPLIYGDFNSGYVTVNGNLNVSGTITATTKNFEIPYPGNEMPGYDLVHSSLEGPENGVFYRGTATLVNGQATITLPSYYGALTRTGSETVYLTAKGKVPFSLSYDSFDHDAGTFIVYGSAQTGEFDWQVEATRADVPLLTTLKPSNR